MRRSASRNNYSNKVTCDRCGDRVKEDNTSDGAYGYSTICNPCVWHLRGDHN